MIVALDDLEKDCGAVLQRLGEDLQQVAVLVIIDENIQLLQINQAVINYSMDCRGEVNLQDIHVFLDLDL